jgi:hypothetical protein
MCDHLFFKWKEFEFIPQSRVGFKSYNILIFLSRWAHVLVNKTAQFILNKFFMYFYFYFQISLEMWRIICDQSTGKSRHCTFCDTYFKKYLSKIRAEPVLIIYSVSHYIIYFTSDSLFDIIIESNQTRIKKKTWNKSLKEEKGLKQN